MESTDFGYLWSCEKGTQEISVCDEHLKMNPDSFQVDMEAFSHLTNKDATFNSRFHLPRSLSRKGEEKKLSNTSVDNERDAIFSPKGTTEPQSHHQISITTTVAAATGTPMKSIPIGKRSSSFKHTSIFNPSRILFFFATLSSIGTIMLIYFTLSMAKHNKDNTY
ncbi:hypothetical protein Hanom_Chr11g01018421 [Helianthus anomalus]